MKRLILLLIFLLLIGSFAFGQERRFPVVAASSSVPVLETHGNGANTPLSFSFNAGSGANRYLLVGVASRDDILGDITAVVFNGVSLTQLKKQVLFGARNIQVWGLVNPASGSHTLAFTGGFNVAAVAASYDNVNQSTPIGTISSTSDSGSVTTGNVNTSSATGNLVVDFLGTYDNASGQTPGSGQTNVDFISEEVKIGSSYKSGATTVNTSWTWTNANPFALIGVPLIAA